jgi:hypothetical protein
MDTRIVSAFVLFNNVTLAYREIQRDGKKKKKRFSRKMFRQILGKQVWSEKYK